MFAALARSLEPTFLMHLRQLQDYFLDKFDGKLTTAEADGSIADLTFSGEG
jgi:hypothetical protein